LLHEFSHVSDKYKKINKERDYYCFITSIDDILNFASKIAAKFYLFSDIFLFIRYTVFDYATTLMIETDADEAMAKYGDPKIAASMLIKFSYHDRFQWEDGSYDSEPLYADEEPPKNSVRNESMKLKKAMEEKSELWNDLASREILANNSTHPTVKMRISALGIEEIKTVHSSSSEAYLDEKEKALDMIDSIIYDRISKNYEEIRRDNYIEPLERITQWEGEGSPLRGESYADIISDLRDLGRCKDAEALCDRAIAELPAASAHSAHFFKGAFLLHRYDASGIDHVYKAIEENMNYCDEGLDMIGSFCCITGREKELAEYREKAVVIAQKNYDEDINASELNKKDDLRGESLPEGMLEDILGYIATIDEGIIDKIYLVRKTISESFFTSAFVVGFSCKDAKKIHSVMHKIFLYLDAHPSGWQFSLFELSEHKDIDFEKIEGSLVYTADKKED